MSRKVLDYQIIVGRSTDVAHQVANLCEQGYELNGKLMQHKPTAATTSLYAQGVVKYYDNNRVKTDPYNHTITVYDDDGETVLHTYILVDGKMVTH